MRQTYITTKAPLPPGSWAFIQSPLKLKQGFPSWPPWGQALAARMNLRAETMRGRQPCLWHEEQERLRCDCESRELPQVQWLWVLVGCLWMEGKAGPSEHELSRVRKYRWEKGRWGSGKKRHDSLLLVPHTLAQSTPTPLCWALYDSEHRAGPVFENLGAKWKVYVRSRRTALCFWDWLRVFRICFWFCHNLHRLSWMMLALQLMAVG